MPYTFATDLFTIFFIVFEIDADNFQNSSLGSASIILLQQHILSFTIGRHLLYNSMFFPSKVIRCFLLWNLCVLNNYLYLFDFDSFLAAFKALIFWQRTQMNNIFFLLRLYSLFIYRWCPALQMFSGVTDHISK